MDNNSRILFDKLTKDREEVNKTLKKRCMRGIKKSVVEKYSETAHFVYELIQNADDTHATYARFVLYPDHLVFAHNGTRYFFVTDPDTEEEDANNGKLGDLNAITSVGSSTKEDDASKIGKFGLGFKAVFQYSENPKIYDPNFWFEIKDLIVPIALESDHPERKPKETLFHFEFNHIKTTAEKAFGYISKKLKNLSFPTLFLSHLTKIDITIGNEVISYEQKSYWNKIIPAKKTNGFKDTLIQDLTYIERHNGTITTTKLWLASRVIDGANKIIVGFKHDDQDELCTIQKPAFCFFPTTVVTHLNFIIHAPFLLTDNREGIFAEEEHNLSMIDHLANLAADSLLILRDIGIERKKLIFKDNIIYLIPTDPNLFIGDESESRISFRPFFDSIKQCFIENEIIPTAEGYCKQENAYWAETLDIVKLFSTTQLREITSDKNAEWVFTSIPRSSDNAIVAYIDDLCYVCLDENDLISGYSREDYASDGLSKKFIENQSIEWLYSLYKWINGSQNRKNLCASIPIFIDSKKNAVSAKDSNGNQILYLPKAGSKDYVTVHKSLLSNKITLELLTAYDVKEPDAKDEIFTKVLPRIKDNEIADPENDFKMLFDYYLNCSKVEHENLINYLKENDYAWFGTRASESEERFWKGRGNTFYFPSKILKTYFSGFSNIYFVNFNRYANWVGSNNTKNLRMFFEEIGVHKNVGVIPKYSNSRNEPPNKELFLGVDVLNKIEREHNSILSNCLWSILLKLSNAVKNNDLAGFFGEGAGYYKEKYHYGRNGHRYYDGSELVYNSSPFVKLLREKQWVIDIDGKFVNPASIRFDQLFNEYCADLSKPSILGLIRCLGISEKTSQQVEEEIKLEKEREEQEKMEQEEKEKREAKQRDEAAQANLSDENKIALELGLELQQLGLTIDEIREFKKAKTEKENRQNQEKTGVLEDALNVPPDDRGKFDLFSKGEINGTSYVGLNSVSNPIGETTKPDMNEQDCGKNNSTRHFGERFNIQLIAKGPEEDDMWFEPSDPSGSSLGNKSPCSETHSSRSVETLEEEYYRSNGDLKSIDTIINASEQTSTGRRKSINNVVANVLERTFDKTRDPVDHSKEITEDSDYYTRPPIDYSRRIKFQEQNCAENVQKLARMDYLSKTVSRFKKYSYGWFTTLLELESTLDGNGKDEKVVSVTFSQIMPVADSECMYVLRYPNHPIPIHIEELSNFRLKLTDNLENIIPIKVEAASVKSFELYVRINKKSSEFDCSKITCGTIEVCSPKFLFDSLRLRYSELKLTDEYNFKDHLTKNIKFVFGPPGTGKTTYLATQCLEDWLNLSSQGLMLVLAPTNKASDVLTNRILSMVFDDNLRQRICRFGNTTDSNIINAGRFIEHSFDIGSLPAPILITTVARFAYDTLQLNGKAVCLCDVKWDIIVIDEASMVSMPQINYLLYKCKSANFVIAGDPFQIQPITQIQQWENENIYTMVDLKEFNLKFTPLGHKVINLSTQYRSVPEIGHVFAEFTYNGLLESARTSNDRIDLGLPNGLFKSSLNLIRFPVKKYESVYCPKALNKSPFQIYSALFTVELIEYITVHFNIPLDRKFSIGIISPYSAQATVIGKILATVDFPSNIKVITDTVHSFQGDECDMIVLVLNTPTDIRNSIKMFVNNRNLLNVAISRARDYLVVLAPAEDTFGYGYLRELKKIIEIMSTTGCLTEYNAKDLEKSILLDQDFIENNTFTTNHQNVNVYGVPEKKYEVRSDKDALDVQVHKKIA